MATTRLITHHISRGETIATSLKDRLDYGKDPDKTDGGDLISAFECDHNTADAEFMLSKAKYKAVTGREQKRDADILCYQIRQSFLLGETTPQEAQKVGYETALRWTKGNHAFFVATHIDRRNIHNHIYYNSTTLDCTHKFRDFKHSAFALRRLSDRVCLENNLSVVEFPKQHSEGNCKHYGEWQGDNKPLSYQQKLRAAVDNCLSEQPQDFDAFLQMMAAAGFEHSYGRGGVLSFRAEGQERFTRLRASTLGDGYGQEDIQAMLAGRAALPTRKAKTPMRRVNLIIDIQEKMRNGKDAAYARWAQVYNLKQMAAALQYLQENDLLEYADLEARASGATDRFHDISDKLKITEAAMNRNAELKAATVDYAKTRAVFAEYKATKYSRKFLAENEADITVHRAARAAMQELLHGARLPKMDALKAEWQTLLAEKRAAYREYRAAQKDLREVVAAKTNIDALLGVAVKNKEQER